ncbi:hypothetical protein K505DRAFT_328463 [Melanomma pulvis-pyrius CBS 109.77]|uniref:S-adenosyl-L-methionine-dependent methyltransferase n=1 Tax=Melanomma pulvis-pyrius CBS 109.77 TaxID=1314802 RepID=A0A6A6WYE5_9PLEO|nr:hypothetical protein K505DRAFT_328463 [Melanomma pulvis-pyrius CBS 109.77]
MASGDEYDPEYETTTMTTTTTITTATTSPGFKVELPTQPKLSQTPIAHSGCCLALSTPLLAHLQDLLPASPSLILSIGSGYGLLEAFLLAEPYSLHVTGVEVQPSPNRYLPPTHHRCVSGSRFLHPLAGEAAAWLLVYPRRVGLVTEYLDTYGKERVETVVWVGPRADWEDYRDCFNSRWDVHVKSTEEVGGRAWELIAVARKKS